MISYQSLPVSPGPRPTPGRPGHTSRLELFAPTTCTRSSDNSQCQTVPVLFIPDVHSNNLIIGNILNQFNPIWL